VLPSVPMPSDAYRRLCHTGSTTVHCQLTRDSVTNRCQNVPHHNKCTDVRWLRLHSVLPASPVMTAQLDTPATLTSVCQIHDVRRLRFLGSHVFVVAHFNNISSTFRDWFLRIRTNPLPPHHCYL